MNPLGLFKKSSFAPAFLFLSSRRRRALAAIYAFARAVDDAVDEGGSPAELDRWRALLRAPYVTAAEGLSAPAAWPALEWALRSFPVDRKHLLDLIDGVSRDLGVWRAESVEDFKTYCHGVAATVGLACLPVFGLDEEGHRDFAVNMGYAVQTVNIVRDVRADALAGRVYLPWEDMRRFGVGEGDVRAPSASAGLLRLLRFEASRARGFFAAARGALPPISRRPARTALTMGALYEKLLDKMERDNFFWGRPRPVLTGMEKAAVVLRALAAPRSVP